MLEQLDTVKITRKKFLYIVGATILAVPFFSKSVFARVLLRKTDGSLLDIDDIQTLSTSDDLAEGTVQWFNQITVENEDTLSIYTSRVDMGAASDSNPMGYYETLLTDKYLYHCTVGVNDNAVEGGVRVVEDTALGENVFQVYLEGDWRTALTGVRLKKDENSELEFKPSGSILWINTHSGDSDEVGLNDRPLVQSYRASMGAYPPKEVISGGTF